MSRVFYAIKRGEDFTLPVAESDTTWAASVQTVADNFVQTATQPDIGSNRAFTLPALCVRFDDLVAALFRRFPDSAAKITYAPDPAMSDTFGSMPPLTTETADGLGFANDTGIDALVAGAV